MTPQAESILELFRSTGAYLNGHFRLTSGLHSPEYLQCALVLQYPDHAEKLGRLLAESIRGLTSEPVALVASPALGGVIIGHEVGRALGVDAMFVERPTGTFELRRGFALNPGDKVLMVEDVVTTGLSSREAILAIEEAGAQVIAAASLVDRSGGSVDLGVPFHPLIALSFPTYAPEDVPESLAATPAVKPGSRAA